MVCAIHGFLNYKLLFFMRQLVNAAVIVDPSLNQIITSASDEISSWNMHFHGNEALSLDADEASISHDAANVSPLLDLNLIGLPSDSKTSCSRISCLNPWQWSLSSSTSCFLHPLRHAAMVAIEHSAAKDIRLYPVGEADEKSVQLDPNATPKRRKTILANVSCPVYYEEFMSSGCKLAIL